MLDFINLHLIDILDILLVGLLIYQIYKLIRGTAAMSIFIGIIILYFIWLVVKTIHMEVLSAILGQVLGVGVLALIIIFQQEIRRFLIHLGNNSIHRNSNFFTRRLFGTKTTTVPLATLDELTQAVRKMSETKTGALIVMTHKSSLEGIIETGDRIDAVVNRRLIENLFFKNSPLHDGAMIIAHQRINAAGCILPVSHNLDIPKDLGLRHRAALGVSQETDALAIVVSEETGSISIALNGEFRLRLSAEELEGILTTEMNT